MRAGLIPLLLSLSACGSSSNASGGAGAAAVAGGAASTAGTGAAESGGTANSASGAAGTVGQPLPPDPCLASGTCPPNTWIRVTPNGIQIPAEGLRSIVADPKTPSDLYMGAGAAGIWKSTDYGNTWAMINQGFGYIPQGLCIAVLPSEPRTLLVADSCACGRVHKSTDGGASFTTVGGNLPSDLYSLVVDPYNPSHIISGFHEASGIAESTDAGDTWHVVDGTGLPTGGVSWFPSFIDTGVAGTTAGTWIAIAQNAGSPAMTHDGGKSWTVPTGLDGVVHPHGEAQIFQSDKDIFIAGSGHGDGVFVSHDSGMSFTLASGTGPAAIVWGTPNHVYSAFAWSCFNCTIDPNFQVGSKHGDTWSRPGVPKEMLMGADHVAVTNDGNHYIFVAAMRNSGIWRYVEE